MSVSKFLKTFLRMTDQIAFPGFQQPKTYTKKRLQLFAFFVLLQATLISVLDDDDQNNEDYERVTYSCSLNPFFDLKKLDSSQFEVKVEISSLENSSLASTKASQFLPTLTVTTESQDFHNSMAVSKCVFLPVVVSALAFFLLRSYQNDLYVAIPDRLLIASALALILNNIPLEFIIERFQNQDWTALAKVLDEVVNLGPMVSLALFWSVYTGDKLARNEPWERNTRYYVWSVGSVALGSVVAAVFVIFTQGSSSLNPFRKLLVVGAGFRTGFAQFVVFFGRIGPRLPDVLGSADLQGFVRHIAQFLGLQLVSELIEGHSSVQRLEDQDGAPVLLRNLSPDCWSFHPQTGHPFGPQLEPAVLLVPRPALHVFLQPVSTRNAR